MNNNHITRRDYLKLLGAGTASMVAADLPLAFTPEDEARRMNLLWYRQPAAIWNEALPIGNGRLGGMVFGGVPLDRIQHRDELLAGGGLQSIGVARAVVRLD